jgi:AraC-like DNA-binding protein
MLGPQPPGAALDTRIQKVLDWLARTEGDGPTLAKAASVACLSESRFSHLFVEEKPDCRFAPMCFGGG